jgi:hypothetical protein
MGTAVDTVQVAHHEKFMLPREAKLTFSLFFLHVYEKSTHRLERGSVVLSLLLHFTNFYYSQYSDTFGTLIPA